MSLCGKTVVVGITGGISAYKICNVVSSLKKEGADVYVIMTKNATEFIAPLTFETLSANRVVVDTFDREFEWEVEHVSLAKKANVFLVAPCTANFAGKLANGIADDFMSTTALAMKCPIIIAPAMNTAMLTSQAYKENERILKERGMIFIDGESGRLACGDEGKGRLAEPEKIVEKLKEILCPKHDYDGKTILITAGGTSEPIDNVRYISNRSSGRMGVALAQKALDRGARVILVSANLKVSAPKGVEEIKVNTTKEMYDAVLNNYEKADIIIKSAAPSDYRLKEPFTQKIKGQSITLELVKNPDIAKAVGKVKGGRKLIIFSAETNDCEKNAQKKLSEKNADMVVLNDVTKQGAGFDVDTNIVTIITNSDKTDYPKMEKMELADIILERINQL